MDLKYDIVVEQAVGSLRQKVQDKLNDGWSLVGGPFLDSSSHICQAVIRRASQREVLLESGKVTESPYGSMEFEVPHD